LDEPWGKERREISRAAPAARFYADILFFFFFFFFPPFGLKLSDKAYVAKYLRTGENKGTMLQMVKHRGLR